MVGVEIGKVVGSRVGVSVGADVPAPIALGFVAWFDAATGVTREIPGDPDSGVLSIRDRIGGFVASHGVSAQLPKRQDVGPSPSGYPSLLFSRLSSQRLICTLSGSLLQALKSDPFTVYSWCRPTSADAIGNPWTITEPSSQWGDGILNNWTTTQNVQLFYGNGASVIGSTLASYAVGTDYWQYAAPASDTSRRGRVRGSAEVHNTQTIAWPGTATQLNLGFRVSGGSAQQFWDGHLYGVAVKPGLMTADEHAEMQAFIDEQLGI